MRITSHPRRRSSTALPVRALVLGATTAALLLLTTGAAHADPVGDVLDTVQGTLDDTVDTVQGTLDETVSQTVDTVTGTVGGSVHPGTDEPDPTTPEDPTSGGGTPGSDGGHGHEPTGSHSAGQGSPSVVVVPAGQAQLESTGGDGVAADPIVTGVGGGLNGSLTPPRGPAGPVWPGFGTTEGRIALGLLVAAIAVFVLFHAAALWLRMADQPGR